MGLLYVLNDRLNGTLADLLTCFANYCRINYNIFIFEFLTLVEVGLDYLIRLASAESID